MRRMFDEGYRIVREKDYFSSLEKMKEELGQVGGIPCIVYDRVSTPGQEADLVARREIVIAKCEQSGFRVLEYFGEVANGQSNRLHERKELDQALSYAKELDAVLIPPSVDRLIRSREENNFAPLRGVDIKPLVEMLGSVRVATLIPPDTPLEKVRGIMSQWGQQGKGNRGGRPKKKVLGRKKAIRLKFLPIALKLWREKLSYRKIAKKILEKYGQKISWNTIAYWIRKHEKQEERPP